MITLLHLIIIKMMLKGDPRENRINLLINNMLRNLLIVYVILS